MTSVTLTPDTATPLAESHHRVLAAAARQSKAVRKAARVANFNGWTTAIIAALSAVVTLFAFDLIGLLVTLALFFVAYNEFRGRKRLLDFDPARATLLGWNQVGLLTLIVVYCLWALYSNLYGSSSIEAQLKANPQLGAAFGSLDEMNDLLKPIVVAFYATVIALSAVFQGGNALYYFSRRKYVEQYVRETPAWVIDLQRATSAT